MAQDTEQWQIEKMLFYLPCKVEKAMKKIYVEQKAELPCKDYQLPVLKIIYYNDGITQKEISNDIPFDKSRVSVIVNELIASGWVVDTGEGRSSCLHLTEEGTDVTLRGNAVNGNIFSQLFQDFSDEERAAMLETCIKLNGYLDKFLGEKKD